MSDSSVVGEIHPVIVPVVDDEDLGSMDDWLRSLRGPGEPTVLSRPTYVLLEEARAEGR